MRAERYKRLHDIAMIPLPFIGSLEFCGKAAIEEPRAMPSASGYQQKFSGSLPTFEIALGLLGLGKWIGLVDAEL